MAFTKSVRRLVSPVAGVGLIDTFTGDAGTPLEGKTTDDGNHIWQRNGGSAGVTQLSGDGRLARSGNTDTWEINYCDVGTADCVVELSGLKSMRVGTGYMGFGCIARAASISDYIAVLVAGTTDDSTCGQPGGHSWRVYFRERAGSTNIQNVMGEAIDRDEATTKMRLSLSGDRAVAEQYCSDQWVVIYDGTVGTVNQSRNAGIIYNTNQQIGTIVYADEIRID